MAERPKLHRWLRRVWDERDREFFRRRSLLLVIAMPTGVLVGLTAASAESGGRWWLWAAAAVTWPIASVLGFLAIWEASFGGRASHARRR